MNYKFCLSCLVPFFASVAFAGVPVASVSSTQPFTLDGNSVWAAGVNSWPVVLGDEIETVNAPATISFPDGSRISLAAHSHAKLTGTDAEPKIILVAGSVDYNLAPGSKVTLSREARSGGTAASSSAVANTTVQNKSRKALYGTLGAGGAAAAVGAALLGSGHHSSSSQSQLSPQ